MYWMADSYEKYLAEISRYPRIPVKREGELSRIIHGKSTRRRIEAAVEELVQSNLGLVVHCLKTFEAYLRCPDVRLSRMDLIGEGNVALMRAARSFDAGFKSRRRGAPDEPAPFGRYACKCIRLAMLRAVKLSRLIRVPEYHFKYWGQMRKLRDTHGQTLSDEVMVREMDINPQVLNMLRRSESCSTFMLEDLDRSADGSPWEEWMPDGSSDSPAQEVERRDMRRFLEEEMERLPERTRRILEMVFLEETRSTLSELAGLFGISAERCRQVCVQGLTRLRMQIEGRRRRIDPALPAAIGAEAAA